MVYVTDLERLGACKEAVCVFQQKFPQGASSRELMLALAQHPQGVEWWEWLGPKVPELRAAFAKYDADIKSIDKQNEAETQPIYKQYWVAHQLIADQYWASRKLIEDKYREDRKRINERFREFRRAALISAS